MPWNPQNCVREWEKVKDQYTNISFAILGISSHVSNDMRRSKPSNISKVKKILWKHILQPGIIITDSVSSSLFMKGFVDPQNRGVFITGCDTGYNVFYYNFICLGNCFARYLDRTGFIVFAGCLNKNSDGAQSLLTQCSSRIHVIEVNTTKQESISAAFTYIKEHLPSKGLWGIINNAGMDMLGDVELVPISLYEKGLELNLYGYIRVMKTFLPLIRHSKGRVVNVSSVRGRISEPNQSNYITAKHGIETVSDSLRLEMIKFGVKVCIIEPGDFSNVTAIGSEAVTRRKQQEIKEMWELARDEVKQSYTKKYLDSWIDPPAGDWLPRPDITVVAKAVEHALCSVNPKHRYLVQGKWSVVPLESWLEYRTTE